MIKANVGDYVIYHTGTGRRDPTQVRKVTHVDAKGRLYFHPSKDWRDGYEPETGHSRNSRGRIERLATEEEIAEHLKSEKQKQRDRQENEVRRQSQEYVDMQLIQSTIEHQPEQFLGTFTKDEIHEIAERLRQQEEDKANG